MPLPLLATKLYLPQPRPNAVVRPRLLARLDAARAGKLTLVVAPAGAGKTTLVSAWAVACGRPVAWLALDAADADPVRFVAYLVAAIQRVVSGMGSGVLAALERPQPPVTEALLSALINDLTQGDTPLVLVLDDYHVLGSAAIDAALAFFVEYLPHHVQLVIATRELPQLPRARWRARNQLAEVHAVDLRFDQAETNAFLNRTMELGLAPNAVAALAARTEGWVAGLQLAALSLQRHDDPVGFIASFTGNNQVVAAYLIEEVWQKQPVNVQAFLQQTAILDRMSGALCDALLDAPAGTGQTMLEYLEHANLFVVALDEQRHWYRYHQLFGEALQTRLRQLDSAGELRTTLHARASDWYAAQDLVEEAFRHAVAVGDLDRATQLVGGATIALRTRTVLGPILAWLDGLPVAVLDARPMLHVTYASALLTVGRISAVAPALDAAECAIARMPDDAIMADLLGQVAAMRATMAIMQHDVATIRDQSRRALALLHADNHELRTAATWTLGYAHQLAGERQPARAAYARLLANHDQQHNSLYYVATISSIAQLDEADAQLHLAAAGYQRVLVLAGDPPHVIACEAHLGLARIAYQHDDLAAAQQHAETCLRLARQIERIETYPACLVVLANLARRSGDYNEAAALLAQAADYAAHHGFSFHLPVIAAAQLLLAQTQAAIAADAAVVAPVAPDTGLLSAREHEILQLIAQGLSNQQIGAQLFLALDTVKGHNRRIFAKLDARNRTTALARARELGLL